MLQRFPDIISIKNHPANKFLRYSKITKTPAPIKPRLWIQNSGNVSMSLDFSKQGSQNSFLSKNSLNRPSPSPE
jgi:hypothetical protein